jgi:hypothetical protein
VASDACGFYQKGFEMPEEGFAVSTEHDAQPGRLSRHADKTDGRSGILIRRSWHTT